MSSQLSRRISQTTSGISSATARLNYSTTPRGMAQPIPASETISQTAKQENDPTKNSTSAQMQSQVGKTRNFEQAAQEIARKMQNQPDAVTSEDANYLKSREARAMGQAQPPSDSISADAQRLAAANEGATKPTTGSLDPAEQSAADRLENFESAAQKVAPKMAKDPEHVSKNVKHCRYDLQILTLGREDADLLHSREQRAFGQTSEGGIASQAQSLVAENEQKSTT